MTNIEIPAKAIRPGVTSAYQFTETADGCCITIHLTDGSVCFRFTSRGDALSFLNRLTELRAQIG